MDDYLLKSVIQESHKDDMDVEAALLEYAIHESLIERNQEQTLKRFRREWKEEIKRDLKKRRLNDHTSKERRLKNLTLPSTATLTESQLPNEIWLQIFDKLQGREIKQLSQCSRWLYLLITGYLNLIRINYGYRVFSTIDAKNLNSRVRMLVIRVIDDSQVYNILTHLPSSLIYLDITLYSCQRYLADVIIKNAPRFLRYLKISIHDSDIYDLCTNNYQEEYYKVQWSSVTYMNTSSGYIICDYKAVMKNEEEVTI